MKEKIMTPSLIWGNYNPDTQPLETSILKIVEDDDKIIKHLSFTSEIADDGKVLAHATLFYKKDVKTKMPTILICANEDENVQLNQLTDLIEAGFIIATFDYLGETETKEFFTKYPPSLSFCNNKNNLIAQEETSFSNTAIYHWAIIARRTISMICQDPICDADNIAVMGILTGMDIMWQVAAMDERVKTCIPVLNFGWRQESDLLAHSIEENSSNYNDYISKIGFTAESYINLVKAAILFIGATNSELISINKIDDTLNRLPKTTERKTCITLGNGSHLGNDALPTIVNWLSMILNQSTTSIPSDPFIDINLNAKKEIIFKIKYDFSQEIDNVILFLSDDEKNPIMRNWHTYNVEIKENGISTFKYLPTENVTDVLAFANIRYKNGFTISSHFKTFDLTTDTDIKHLPAINSRIIFDNNSSIESFFPQSKNLFSVKETVFLKEGPHHIAGVCTEQAILTTYLIGDSLYRGKKNNLLHVDFFSPIEKTISIIVQYIDLETNEITEYTTDLTLKDTERWQGFLFSKSDFKDESNKQLRNWENVKSLTFSNIDNVIINNMLWV